MLTLLLGTDWVANRNEIYKMISQDVLQEKSGRILMVPELMSYNAERLLCESAGDTASRFSEVLSFTRLARRVADTVGHGAQECLDNGGRVVAMASSIRQLHSRLKAYASVETRPEFLTGLVDIVDEFKRCCISSEDLMRASRDTQGSLAQKLEELSLILDCYDGLCQHGKKDPCDQMVWLLEELESSDFAKNHVFYIDGFPDFTRQHMAILEHIIRHSDQVVVSVNCDRIDTQKIAFERTAKTASDILRCAKHWNVEAQVCYVEPRSDKLNLLRENIFEGDCQQKLSAEQLQLYRTQSVYQECLLAAEKIKNLICQGNRYRDIGVVCTEPSEYHNTIEMVFNRCHIPAYISGTENILDKSVIQTVLSAMDTALHGFTQQDVLHYLKSSLSPIDLSTGDRLENYAEMWGITGSRWLADWEYHPDGLGSPWSDEARDLLQTLNNARKLALEPLVELRNGFRSAENLGQQVQALYRFLERIDLSNRLDTLAKELDRLGDKRNTQILNQLWEILISAMEQMYDVLGQTVWDEENFSQLFRLLLSQYDVGTIPPVLDSVTIGSVSSMRCQQTKHLIVLGAAEGSFPKYGSAFGVLTDQERTALRQIGVPLNGGAPDCLEAEFTEIYGVFCGAEDSVTVSCSGGQPSFLYHRLCAISQGEDSASSELSMALCDKHEAAAYLVRKEDDTAAAELGLQELYEDINEKKTFNLGCVTPENVQRLYGKTLKLSASQVDKLADCRLSYFLRYGMRTMERKQATVDPAEFGSYVHAVLENTARQIMELGGFKAVSLDKVLEIARQNSEIYANERFSQLDTQRLKYLFQRNCYELEQIVKELWDEMQNSSFLPFDFEVGFGDGCQLPAINISGREMNAQLRGFVDRIDCWNNGKDTYFRVVDYKTGKKDFDYCDIFNGVGLQMLLYLFALEQEWELLIGNSGIPAGVQYFPARAPLVTSDGILTEEDAVAERNKLWKRKGLLLSDDAVLQAMENSDSPKRMPYSRTKDGTLTGDLANKEQFALLRKYVFKCLEGMIDTISSGDITPNPYTRGNSHNACTFCPYSSVCHLETVTDRRNYKTMSAKWFWEAVEEEVKNRG